MSRDELAKLSDHDLLILLHERMDNHLKDHSRSENFWRWFASFAVGALAVILATKF